MSYMINGVDIEAVREEAARMQGEVMLKTLKATGRVIAWPFVILAEAIAMAQHKAALEEMSDAELARMGIAREQILGVVVGNIKPEKRSAPFQVIEAARRPAGNVPERKAA